MIIVKSTEIAMKLISAMEGESHLVEDEPYLIEEDREHHGLTIIDGSGSRYVIHPVSGEIGIFLGKSSTKSIEKWTEAGGRDWDAICETTCELSRGASAKQDIIVRLPQLVASNRVSSRIRLIPPRKTLLNYYTTWMHGEGVFYCNLCDFRSNEPSNYQAYEKILEHLHSAHPEEVATAEKVATKDHDSTHLRRKWYRKAADKGLASAQGDLGIMYYEGIGVPQDYSEAAKWYRKAAEQGLPEAQYFLGVMYHNGQGVPQDYVLAHMWLNLAALRFPASEKKNQEMANKDRDITASEMTPAQIAEAQKLAREWKPKLELGREKGKDQEKKTTPAEKKTEKESAMEIWQREDR